MRGFVSIDIDVSELQVNQCNVPQLYDHQRTRSNRPPLGQDEAYYQIEAFHESNKCHMDSMQVNNHLLILKNSNTKRNCKLGICFFFFA